jgi:hypothetical protein
MKISVRPKILNLLFGRKSQMPLQQLMFLQKSQWQPKGTPNLTICVHILGQDDHQFLDNRPEKP